MFAARARSWWFFCLTILLFKLLLLAVDPLPRLHPESASYLWTAVTGSVSEDLPYLYGFVVRWLCNWPASLNSLLIVQALLGAGTAIALAWICRAIFCLSQWATYLFGFLCAIDPLQLSWERCIVPDIFSMFLYALVLWQSFVYLNARRLTTLLIIQVLSTITIAFRSTFLIPFQVLAIALPAIGFAFDKATAAPDSASQTARLQFFRCPRFWRHLAASVLAMVVLGQAYSYAKGFFAQHEPAYFHSSGYFLLSTWAPALQPQDSPDPRLAEIIRHGNEFDLANHGLRNAQRFAAGRLVDRWRRAETDRRKAGEIAGRTALNALARDPAAIIKIAAQTYYAFWRGLSMERFAEADFTSAKVTDNQQESFLERYHCQNLSGASIGSFSTRYYVGASPYYFAILLSPLLALALLFLAREKPHAILLVTHTLLLFVVTFLFAISPSTRSLQPLSLLTLLGIALAVKSLYLSTSGEREAREFPIQRPWRKVMAARPAYTVVVLVVLAAILRVGLAGNQPLWNDETFSLAMSTGHSLEQSPTITNQALGDFVLPDRPTSADELRGYVSYDQPPAGLSRVIRAVFLSDTSPPLYYVFLYFWTLAFGTSDFVLREFSTLCALACFPFVAGIACRTAGSKALLPACLLFAFSPLGICFSTEARMYSLLWLCVVAITWLSLVWRATGTGVLLPAAWVGASAAGFLSHYFFAFPWFAVVAFLFLQPGKLRRLRLATCMLFTGLLISPWYIGVPESLRGWRLMKDWLRWEPDGFSRVRAIVDLVLQNFSGAGHHVSSNAVALVLFALVFGAMALRLHVRMFTGRRLLLWLLFLAPCAGLLLFDAVMHTYTMAHERYAIAALPIGCVLAAAALVSLANPTRTVLLILVLVAWAPNLLLYQQTAKRLVARQRAAAVSGNSPDDLIVIDGTPSGLLNIVRYLNGEAPIVGWMPAWLQEPAAREPPEKILQLAAGRTRIWWLAAAGAPPKPPEREWLREHALVLHETNVTTEFAPTNGATF
jgi:uncharacterized membrane protein